MTALLERAFSEARKLPPEQQDALGSLLLDEIADEAKWDELFARPESEALLARLGAEAMAEHRAGRTLPLDPDTLGAEP